MKKIGIIILTLAILFLHKSGVIVARLIDFEGMKSSVFNVVEYFTGDDKEVEQDMQSIGYTAYENYKHIKIGDSFNSVKANIGEPTSIEYSEYDFKWYVYAEDYSRFFMVGVYDGKVVALFSNTMNSGETDIYLDATKAQIRDSHTPVESRLIGNIAYVSKEEHFDVFKIDEKYITVFYDTFDANKAKGVQIVSEDMEKQLKSIYPTNVNSIYSLENINRYVLNAERIKRGLSTLKYDENTTLCARSHSEDMRDNGFFSHDNLKGQSPFDRMEGYGVRYMAAAENIAAGQTSSIFAHYGLLNSEGHRINMLGEYKYIGVGVALGGKMEFYLTQNFFR